MRRQLIAYEMLFFNSATPHVHSYCFDILAKQCNTLKDLITPPTQQLGWARAWDISKQVYSVVRASVVADSWPNHELMCLLDESIQQLDNTDSRGEREESTHDYESVHTK